MEFTYLKQPPTKWTFSTPKTKEWVESRCEGHTLNLFAGKTKLNVNEVRVDLSPEEAEADYYIDAFEFIQYWIINGTKAFNTIILDPPWNIRKAREKYQGRYIGSFTKIKNELHKIMAPNCKVITFGYDSTGMSKSRGFEKEEILLINNSGDHNDVIAVVERKIE
jgi:hypothetical protein